jgi:hypothetical protein
VRALAAQGRTDEAIDYAERSLGRNDGPSDMARTCEAILLAAGRGEDAYRRFAYTANRAGSHLATFRAIKKKYPDKAPRAILDDLIAQTPGEEGKWFATAKDLGLLDLALDLARRSPVDIGAVSAVVGIIQGKSAIHLARVYGERRRNFVGQGF